MGVRIKLDATPAELAEKGPAALAMLAERLGVDLAHLAEGAAHPPNGLEKSGTPKAAHLPRALAQLHAREREVLDQTYAQMTRELWAVLDRAGEA